MRHGPRCGSYFIDLRGRFAAGKRHEKGRKRDKSKTAGKDFIQIKMENEKWAPTKFTVE